MNRGQERIDNYTWSEHKKIITHDHHHIPGVANISHMMLSNTDNTEQHYHADILEIHCIVKGQRTVQVLSDGRITKYTATGNELTIIYPFELHETQNRDKNRNEFYAIQLNTRKTSSRLGLNEEYSSLLLNELLHLPNRHLQIGNSHLSLLRTAFNLLAYGTSDDSAAAVGYLTCFLFGLKYLNPIVTESRAKDDPIQPALKYISEHLEQPLPLQKLADLSGYSLSHFKFRFKEYCGITPAEYISLQKISAAEKELLTTDISVTELAHKLSFSSSNYFCTVFKKVLGYSPTDYRKMFCEK